MVALFVAFMFVGFVLTDLFVQRIEARRAARVERAAASQKAMKEASKASARLPWALPDALHLAENHAWLIPQPQQGLLIGADALLGHALGSVEAILLPPMGAEVQAGEPLFHVELDGRMLTVTAPVAGKVISTNQRLKKDPRLVAQDPYGSGWVCSLIPVHKEKPALGMRSGSGASLWLEKEFGRFKEFVSKQVPANAAVGLTSQDGGLPIVGVLGQLKLPVWRAFEAEFFRTR